MLILFLKVKIFFFFHFSFNKKNKACFAGSPIILYQTSLESPG